MALIVVHRDHRVILAGPQLDEHGVARHRAFEIVAVALEFGDRGLDDVDILPPEEATLSSMGLSAATAILRRPRPKAPRASSVSATTRRRR